MISTRNSIPMTNMYSAKPSCDAGNRYDCVSRIFCSGSQGNSHCWAWGQNRPKSEGPSITPAIIAPESSRASNSRLPAASTLSNAE